MDLATAIGLLSGLFLLVWAIKLGGPLDAFLHLPSLMIVVGGTLAATLISYPLKSVIGVFGVLKKAFFNKLQDPAEIINTLVKFAEKARREGLLALEMDAEEIDDKFLQKGIQLVVDGTDPELVKSILETDLAFLEERHRAGRAIFETMGQLSPAFGMIGTLIGLIQMLGSLNNPEEIGPGMATALITTFYGILMANLVFNPIAGKLKVRTSEEVLLREVMIEGILSIQAGENPRIVEEKMKVFLAPRLRENIAYTRERQATAEEVGE
ncbi:MAG: MotA/TolQ/ExbB proton channel [Thermoanaerobacterales bacterium 50_218]|nr:MAG: MotA/TolQ/ExbB proton channel [Thermoanaerobacterales bacterium 50_218]HAA90247.1 motility protein A [Peptococcaceae bacterium]